MIVKNEAKIIRRCLDSVRPFIDHWVIVDTGSTDGTQALICDILKDIPGTLHERPWKNFGHNRSEAIALAEGTADFILLTDADMVLEVHDPHWRPDTRHDGYYVQQLHGERQFANVRLANGRLSGNKRWCYRCATHEYIDSTRGELNQDLPHTNAISFLDLADGGSKADKFERDARLLEAELARLEAEARTLERIPSGQPGLDPYAQNDKQRQRTMFYLAQTYRDAEQPQRALSAYQQRAAMGGWDEEIWYSLFQAANVKKLLQYDVEFVRQAYLQAFETRPTRAEPLVALASFEREHKAYARAHLYARYACELPIPNDLLFLERNFYDWLRYDELAVAAYWIGRYEESALMCRKLLALPVLPGEMRARIEENLNHAQTALQHSSPAQVMEPRAHTP